MKIASIIWLALSLCACSKPGVRCDGRLEAINTTKPAPVAITRAPPNQAPEASPPEAQP
jgi:hypothetical protein